MYANAVIVGKCCNRSELAQRHDTAGVRVFDDNHPCRTAVEVIREHNASLHIIQSHVDPILRGDGLDQGARERGHTASFHVEDMGAVVRENSHGRLEEVTAQRDLIGHGARNAEKGSGLAAKRSHVLFQVRTSIIEGVTEGGSHGGIEHG